MTWITDRSRALGWINSWTSVLGTTLIILLLTFFWNYQRMRSWWKRRERLIRFAATLPGPPALPLIGNALQFACEPEETLDKIVEVCRSHKSPFRFWLGPKLLIILTEPSDYEIILNNSKASHKDSAYRFMEPFVGKGLVSGSGPGHRLHRKLIMPMLNSKSLSHYVEYFNRHSKYCADLLNELTDNGEFEILPFLTRCTVDIILDTIIGIEGDSQKNGRQDLVYWTERMYELVHLRMLKAWLHPDWIFSLTELGAQQKIAQNVIHGFVESVIGLKRKEARAIQIQGNQVSDQRKQPVVLLEQIIDRVTETGVMNDKEMRDEVYTVFTAAQDTTAVISSFLLLMLAMHPEKQDKVRQELDEILENSDNVTEEHLSELKYLEMTIRETLRLFPIAPLMVRHLTGDVDLGSCTIPEGCSVVMAPFVTHRSEKFWQDPEKFIPERFLVENSRGRHPCAFLPFSGGLRGCIGQKYAMMCMKTIAANIVRRYRLSTSFSLEKLRLKTDISVRSRDGFKVSITRVS